MPPGLPSAAERAQRPLREGRVSIRRAKLPFTDDEIRQIINLTWEVVGHSPIDPIHIRFDREGTFYHAKVAGFEGNRKDWRALSEYGDPSGYTASVSGLTLTPTCPVCRAFEGISVDVFFFPPFDDEPPEQKAETRREAVSTLAHELAHAADLRILAGPEELGAVSLPRLNPPSPDDEGRDEEAESYAESVAAAVVRRFIGEAAGP